MDTPVASHSFRVVALGREPPLPDSTSLGPFGFSDVRECSRPCRTRGVPRGEFGRSGSPLHVFISERPL